MMYMMIGGGVLVSAVYVAGFAFCRAAARADAAMAQFVIPSAVPTPHVAVPIRSVRPATAAPSKHPWVPPQFDALHMGEVADIA